VRQPDQMPFEKNDILLAFKVIALSDKLNGTDKQTAAFIVDSYNRKTGRCDPSVETQAFYSAKSRRTMFRSIDRLVELKFLRKVRHGGHNHCNSYEPNWEYYRELERIYRQRRLERSKRFARQELSPSGCQVCHSSADKVGTQTSSTNNIQSTYRGRVSNQERSRWYERGPGNENALPLSRSRQPPVVGRVNLPSSQEAARIAAERRWNDDLLDRYRATPAYATVLAAIDIEIQNAATDAELKRRGAGLVWILEELLRRGLVVG
jgi:hypothetical protein